MKRFKITKIIGVLGIISNLFLSLIKLSVGLISKSQSMIADSFNSIGDVFASFMTFIGNKIASFESDDDHNFGHGKAEYIFSLFISISILLIAIKLLYDSIVSLTINNQVVFSWNLINVCIITILVKFSLFLYTKKCYQKENNILIKSCMIDNRNDIFLSLSVLISAIFSRYSIYFVDSLVGIVISIWFLLSAIKLFKESYNVLMDISLDLVTRDKIIKKILKNKKVLDVSDIHSVSIGYKYIVVVTISVDGNLSTFESHDIASKIETKITSSFDNVKEVFVHIHPVKKKS